MTGEGGRRGPVLVTPRSLTREPEAARALAPIADAGYALRFAAPGRRPDEAELLRLVPGCVGWLAGVEPITRRVIDAAPDLRVISRNGTGVDNIDLDAARARGIAVERAAGANARSVAELTIALLLAALRDLPWHARHPGGRPGGDIGAPGAASLPAPGREAAGLALGVIGCGAVGGQVAALAGAFGMRVVAHDPLPRPGFVPAPGFRYVPLAELLRASDVVTLHAPPPRGGGALLGHAELALLKPGCLLLNTARAELVDAAAVVAALDSGRLGGYASDVHLDAVPGGADGDAPLLGHPRVFATPHIGAYTVQAVDRVTAVAVANLLRALERSVDR